MNKVLGPIWILDFGVNKSKFQILNSKDKAIGMDKQGLSMPP